MRKDCALRPVLAERARGIQGVGSITFLCEKLAHELRPGRRIVIMAPIYGDCDGGEGHYYEAVCDAYEVKATITSVDHFRFTSVVDPGDLQDDYCKGGVVKDVYRFRKRQPLQRIVRFLDEPDLPICEMGNVDRKGWHDAMEQPCECAETKALFKKMNEAFA